MAFPGYVEHVANGRKELIKKQIKKRKVKQELEKKERNTKREQKKKKYERGKQTTVKHIKDKYDGRSKVCRLT